MLENVFAYGSLMFAYTGEPAKLVGSYHLNESTMFPVLEILDDDISVIIEGTLIQVSPEELKKIDEYEDYPDTYNRIQLDVFLESGDQVKAWVYVEQDINL
jgi:gamma-glutamylcyclotransferase (GGCT)/AIG2-like uncharacterized protein YtfP